MKGSSDSMNRDEVSKRFTHCCAFSSLGERLATFQKKRLMSRRQNKKHDDAAQRHACPAVQKAQQTAVCGYVQCYNGDQRQRRKKGLYHRQQNGHKGGQAPQSPPAAPPSIPVFQAGAPSPSVRFASCVRSLSVQRCRDVPGQAASCLVYPFSMTEP